MRGFLAIGFIAFGTEAFAQPDQAGAIRAFMETFVRTECGALGGEPYDRCSLAPEPMVDFMASAWRMRDRTCPHPIHFHRYWEMAFECSQQAKALGSASWSDVAQCFNDQFVERHNPASELYCSLDENRRFWAEARPGYLGLNWADAGDYLEQAE